MSPPSQNVSSSHSEVPSKQASTEEEPWLSSPKDTIFPETIPEESSSTEEEHVVRKIYLQSVKQSKQSLIVQITQVVLLTLTLIFLSQNIFCNFTKWRSSYCMSIFNVFPYVIFTNTTYMHQVLLYEIYLLILVHLPFTIWTKLWRSCQGSLHSIHCWP